MEKYFTKCECKLTYISKNVIIFLVVAGDKSTIPQFFGSTEMRSTQRLFYVLRSGIEFVYLTGKHLHEFGLVPGQIFWSDANAEYQPVSWSSQVWNPNFLLMKVPFGTAWVDVPKTFLKKGETRLNFMDFLWGPYDEAATIQGLWMETERCQTGKITKLHCAGSHHYIQWNYQLEVIVPRDMKPGDVLFRQVNTNRFIPAPTLKLCDMLTASAA